MVRIGLPKGGSTGKSRKLIAEYCGRRIDERALSHTDEESGVHFYLLKQRDIPKLVHSGMLDIGITVTEWLVERRYPVQIIQQLDWCDTRVSLLSHNSHSVLDAKKHITCVTEFPNIANQFFCDNNITNFSVEHVSGSCEGLVPSLYDCAIDCVETGTTIAAHKLREEKVIFDSNTVIITQTGKSSRHLQRVLQELAV